MTFALVLLSASVLTQAPIYKWTDKSGEEHFTDDPSTIPKGRRATVLGDDGSLTVISTGATRSSVEPARAEPAVARGRAGLAMEVRALLGGGDPMGALTKVEASWREQQTDAAAIAARAEALALASTHTRKLGARVLGREQAEFVAALKRAFSRERAMERQRAEVAVMVASAALADRDFDRTDRELKDAFENDEAHPVAWALLGDLRLKKNDAKGAIDAWDRGLRKNPGNAALQARLAEHAEEAKTLEKLQRQESDHFYVSVEGGGDAALGKLTVEIMEAAWREVGRFFDHQPKDKIAVVVYADKDFSEAAHASWAAGFYDGKIRVPGGGATSYPLKFKSLLFHEYSHAIFERVLQGARAPAWLNEGLAEVTETLVEPVPDVPCGYGHQLSLGQLHAGFLGLSAGAASGAYPTAKHAVQRLIARFGKAKVLALLERLAAGARFDVAFESSFSLSYQKFAADFDAEAEGH